MSASIESKEIPARTIQQVYFEDQNVLIEAWTSEETENEAIRNACKNLREGVSYCWRRRTATATGEFVVRGELGGSS